MNAVQAVEAADAESRESSGASSNAEDREGEVADDAREIRVSTRLAGSFAEISVEDSGAGVGDDLKHRIFDPFFTTKPKGQGTGLGLSISTDLVRKHGGSLVVAHGSLSGACFVVRLPVVPEPRLQAKSSTA